MPEQTEKLIAEAEFLVRRSAAAGNPVAEFGVTKEIAFVRGVRWASDALEAAEAKIDAVRSLHEKDTVLRDYCAECSDFGSDNHPVGQLIEWPCPTIQALEPLPV